MATEYGPLYFDEVQRSTIAGSRPSITESHRFLENTFLLSNGDLSPIPEEFRAGVFVGISAMIDRYTNDEKTKGEMLPKTSQQFREVFEAKNSAIVVHKREDGAYEPTAHAAMWELFSIDDNIRIFEFGSWIVSEDYRHTRTNEHLTIGEEVAIHAREHTIERCRQEGDQVATIATVKRLNSLKGLLHVGFQPIRFHDVPMTTGATCTCADTSEHYHKDKTCLHRRRDGHGETIHVGNLSINFSHVTLPNGNGSPKIPCTLMCDDPSVLSQIEEFVQSEYARRVMVPFIQTQEINHHSMEQARRLFETLHINI